MKLKTRLIIASVLIVVLPVLLSMLCVVGFGTMQIRHVEEDYGIEFHVGYLFNSTQAISDATDAIYDQLKEDAREDPESVFSVLYLERVNRELNRKLSYLVAFRGDTLYYLGTEAEVPELLEAIRGQTQEEGIGENSTYLGKEMSVVAKQLEVTFSDGSSGTITLITSADAMLPQFHMLAREILILVILVMVITAVVVALWIYRGLSRPIHKLQEATNRIALGDLDFTVEVQGQVEISDLFRDFEEMRRRLQQSEEEKRRYDNESKELISNISHDLKTPVTTVKGYVEGIMDGVADTPEKMDRYIRTIYNKANEMDRLINELTFYSKIGTNRIPYSFTRLNVKAYFDDCAEEVSIDLQEKGIDFSYRCAVEPEVRIIADPEQLTRVMSNIIANAVKYMDKQERRISLRVLDAGDFVQVEIEDNGKGIDPKDLPSIFDRFYRTDASRNSAQGGSGIGLSIARKIVEDHSGKIWALSTAGHGTTLIFVIRKYAATDKEQ